MSLWLGVSPTNTEGPAREEEIDKCAGGTCHGLTVDCMVCTFHTREEHSPGSRNKGQQMKVSGGTYLAHLQYKLSTCLKLVCTAPDSSEFPITGDLQEGTLKSLGKAHPL